jgi:hypothetical protein
MRPPRASSGDKMARLKRTTYSSPTPKRIFSICGFDLQQVKIKNLWEKINNFGKRAA